MGGGLLFLLHVCIRLKNDVCVCVRSSLYQGGKSSEEKSPVFSPINPNAEPGSSEWVYCSLPLSLDLAKGLARKWPGIEETYINTLKGVFQHLRAERENICQYFYDRRYVDEIMRNRGIVIFFTGLGLRLIYRLTKFV